MNDQFWQANQSYGPIIAVANHNGYALRPEVQSLIALDEATRLREEDPFTGEWAMVAPSYMIAMRMRRLNGRLPRPCPAWRKNCKDSAPASEKL